MKKTNLLLIPIVIFAFMTAGFIFAPASGNNGDYITWTKSDNTTVNIPVKVLTDIKIHFASKELPDWALLSPDKDGYEGTRTLELYDYIKSQGIGDPKPVIVAVMDSGFELDHPDLKDNIWNNDTEINGQAGVDDDNNGFVDDFHGWNFLGKAVALNLEVTREYARLKKEGVSETDPYFADVIKEYNTKKQQDKDTYEYIKTMNESLKEAVATLKNAGITTDPKQLQEISGTLSGKEAEASEKILGIYLMAQATPEDMQEYEKEYENKVNLLYDLNFNPSDLIGDNPNKYDEKNYGDNDPSVKTSSHGTHVAGIIGSSKKGVGQAPFVKLMFLRLVPADGDERDKDVANGIRYAADNGASIINLSAGKYYPNNPKYVMDAIKYAESKGVLFVVAAGNEATNIETKLNYPPKFYKEGGEIKYFPNLLCVGASTWMKQYDTNLDPMNYSRKYDLCAPFSNYSNKVVDVFAPGMQINSTIPGKTYRMMSGTSMASPEAAGVAAILKGYFPNLTPKQIKEIMMKSSRKYDNLLVKTKELGKVQFATLSKSGGVVDALNAFKMAQGMK